MLLREYPDFSYIQDLELEEFFEFLSIRQERIEMQNSGFKGTRAEWREKQLVEAKKVEKLESHNVSRKEAARLQRLNI